MRAAMSEEPFHSDIVTDVPDGVDLSEAVRHHTSRPVSLVELLDAFDEAKREVEVQLATAEGPGGAQGQRRNASTARPTPRTWRRTWR